MWLMKNTVVFNTVRVEILWAFVCVSFDKCLQWPFLSLRGQRVCELWSDSYPSLASGWDGPLPVQRLRTVPQDEWPEQTSHPAQKKTGTLYVDMNERTDKEKKKTFTNRLFKFEVYIMENINQVRWDLM